MKESILTPSVISYSAAISACKKSLQWAGALQLFADMQRSILQPNVITYIAPISACGKGQQWAMALQLFADMQWSSLMPNDTTYNLRLHGLAPNCAYAVHGDRADHIALD